VADRQTAETLDRADPIAALRDEFFIGDDSIYLDGHSLGRLPSAVRDRLGEMVSREWGVDLVSGWDRWLGWTTEVGDRLGDALLGAGPEQVAVCDNTTVNLFKAASAALQRRSGALVTDAGNFPTDRYVLEGLASSHQVEMRRIDIGFDEGPDPDAIGRAAEGASLVCLSLVDFRSGALAPMAEITEACHRAGALVCWDLSHAVGAVEIDLDATGADLAVGCTYKYVNAGPGSPAFVYVRRDLQREFRQPIWGWFAQREQFVMGPDYDPVAGVGQFLTGTQSVLGLAAVDTAVAVLDKVGIEAIRTKSKALVGFGTAAARALLEPRGFRLGGPQDPEQRGSHMSLHKSDATDICAGLAASGVFGDARPPDLLRFGLAAPYTRFVDVWDAVARTADVLSS